MAYPEIRYLMLEQLASADLTVSAVAHRIGVLRNSALKSMEKAHSDGIVHIAGYHKSVPIYRLVAGIDEARPITVNEVPEDKPIAPAVPREYAGLSYFELADLLPGVKHFSCSSLQGHAEH